MLMAGPRGGVRADPTRAVDPARATALLQPGSAARPADQLVDWAALTAWAAETAPIDDVYENENGKTRRHFVFS